MTAVVLAADVWAELPTVTRVGVTLIGLGLVCGLVGLSSQKYRRNRIDPDDPSVGAWDRTLAERADIGEDLRHFWVLVPIGIVVCLIGLVIHLVA